MCHFLFVQESGYLLLPGPLAQPCKVYCNQGQTIGRPTQSTCILPFQKYTGCKRTDVQTHRQRSNIMSVVGRNHLVPPIIDLSILSIFLSCCLLMFVLNEMCAKLYKIITICPNMPESCMGTVKTFLVVGFV